MKSPKKVAEDKEFYYGGDIDDPEEMSGDPETEEFYKKAKASQEKWMRDEFEKIKNENKKINEKNK